MPSEPPPPAELPVAPPPSGSARGAPPVPAPRLPRGVGRAAAERVFLQMPVHLGVPPPIPLQQHREVLFLLVAIVGQDLLELRVGRGVDPLVVPVGRLQLFLHGGQRAVLVLRLGPDLALPFAIPHRIPHHPPSERSSGCAPTY